jgi:membrane protein DedA with SNARE-associated domain
MKAGEAELERAERLASRHGAKALVLARPVPVLAKASVLLAAACGMPLSKLVALCAMANAGVSLAYAGVGALAVGVSSFLLAFCGSIAIPAVAMLFERRRRRRRATAL